MYFCMFVLIHGVLRSFLRRRQIKSYRAGPSAIKLLRDDFEDLRYVQDNFCLSASSWWVVMLCVMRMNASMHA